MDRLVERCAGLDVHKASVIACVRIATGEGEGPRQEEIREFATTTQGLIVAQGLAGFLRGDAGGYEATGVYWKPIYYMLEGDFECWLLNARHLKRTSPVGRPMFRMRRGSASF